MASQKPWEKDWTTPQTTGAGNTAPTPTATKKPWEKDWSASATTPPAAQAPNPNTPDAAAAAPAPTPTSETYNNGTGIGGAVVGTGEGIISGLGSAWNAITELPSKAVQVGSEIKHQYDTGTLFTPEFQAAPLTGENSKLNMLARGAGTGITETGRAVAQLPNEIANTGVALGHSIAPETITRDSSQNPVDIYGRDTFGSDNTVSQALQPQTEQGKQIANILPYTVSEGAQIPQVYAMSVKSLQDKGIPLTSENIAQETAHNLTLMGLTVGGAKAGGVAGNAIAGTGVLGKGLQADAMAARFGEQAETVWQGGNQAQQQVVKDVYTGQGNAGFKTAVENAGGENAARAQDVLETTTNEANKQISAAYENKLKPAQAGLDAKKVVDIPVKQTKAAVRDHLIRDEKNGMLEDKTRRVLDKFKDRKFANLREIDDAKRDLSKLKSWAYGNQHFHDYEIISDIQNKLKAEADATVKHFNPDALPAWQEADRLNSQLADTFGRKSTAAKMGNDALMTEEQVEAQLMGNSPAGRARTQRLSKAFSDLKTTQGFTGGEQLASDFNQAMGNTARNRILELSTKAARKAEQNKPGTGEAAFRKKFGQLLIDTEPQMQAIEGLGTQSQQALNQAILDASNMLRPVETQRGMIGNLFDKGIRQAPYVGGVYRALEEPVTQGLRGMMERSKQNWLRGASPEDTERMYQTQQRGVAVPSYAGVVAGEASYIPPVPDNTPAGAATQASAPSVQPMPTAPATVQQEPLQHAQVAHRPAEPELNHGTTTFYRAVSHAETGGEKNRFIFTKAQDKSSNLKSSAYGPAQVTTTLARSYYKNHPELFNAQERDYLDRFIEQGTRMLHSNEPHGSKFGYGGEGVLGGAEDRKLYFRVVHKMMDHMIKKNGGSYEKTIREWRYGSPNADIDKHDPGYAKKVREYFKQHI